VVISNTVVDEVLICQLAIARLGERELRGWWSTDIVHQLGGSDFLRRLVGDTLAPLAAGEGVLLAAKARETQLLGDMPVSGVHSLFLPEPALGRALSQRYRHFKDYPDSVPAQIHNLLEPGQDWDDSALVNLVWGDKPRGKTDEANLVQTTRFGLEVVTESLPDTSGYGVLTRIMAQCVSRAEKGHYVPAYYRSKPDA